MLRLKDLGTKSLRNKETERWIDEKMERWSD
jgi:hypothetical protein